MKTYMATASNIERKGYVVNVEVYTLGRLALQFVYILCSNK